VADRDPPREALEVIGPYLQVAAKLGERTAELHLALASNEDDPDFAPEPLTSADWSAAAVEASREARRAFGGLRENLGRLPKSLHPQAHRVLAMEPSIEEFLAELPKAPIEAAKIRCHGDYHLGQVLRAEGDYVVLDFEGEPSRTIEQRRAKQSPIKDVAGMLRSFSYAAYAGLFAFTEDWREDVERLVPWTELWQKWASAAFLKQYRSTAGTAAFLPPRPDQFSILLQFFMLEKACYELVYELNNRPDWVRIPLKGILSLGRNEEAMAP
jgi:maltose alpha-D-glucosyltransferase / alpha-amylase